MAAGLKPIAIIALAIGAVGSAFGWWFHAVHFYYAWFVAYCFTFTLASFLGLWTLRNIGVFAILATPLIIGWLTLKFSLPPDAMVLLELFIGGFLAIAGLRGRRDTIRALTFVWLLVAVLIWFVDHRWPTGSGQWIPLIIVVVALRLASPVISRNWRFLFPPAHWLDAYVRIMPLKHSTRIPYGNLWVDILALILVISAAISFGSLQKLPRLGKK